MVVSTRVVKLRYESKKDYISICTRYVLKAKFGEEL